MLSNILESYTVNTYPFSLPRGQRVIISNDEDCVLLSSAVFKICGQQSVNVSYNPRSEVHCMQSVNCSLQSAVCSLQMSDTVHVLLKWTTLYPWTTLNGPP